jgi:hypothetical protein
MSNDNLSPDWLVSQATAIEADLLITLQRRFGARTDDLGEALLNCRALDEDTTTAIGAFLGVLRYNRVSSVAYDLSPEQLTELVKRGKAAQRALKTARILKAYDQTASLRVNGALWGGALGFVVCLGYVLFYGTIKEAAWFGETFDYQWLGEIATNGFVGCFFLTIFGGLVELWERRKGLSDYIQYGRRW